MGYKPPIPMIGPYEPLPLSASLRYMVATCGILDAWEQEVDGVQLLYGLEQVIEAVARLYDGWPVRDIWQVSAVVEWLLQALDPREWNGLWWLLDLARKAFASVFEGWNGLRRCPYEYGLIIHA